MNNAEHKVLATDHRWPDTKVESRILSQVGAALITASTQDEDKLLSYVPGVVGILTCFAKVSRRVIEAADNCRIIVRCGVGVDNVDLEAATERGIMVANVPDYCADEVSDHAMAMILSLARSLSHYDRDVKKGLWDQGERRALYRIRGRVLGIIGLGRIGGRTHAKAQPFGLRTIAYDPYLTKEEIEAKGAAKVDFDTLISTSDFISIHCPLTEETRGMISERELRKMKPTAILVNTARGGIVDAEALTKALAEKWITAAGIDVLPAEPPDPASPILRSDNALLSPHAAYYSEESLIDLRRKATEEVARAIRGERPVSLVNEEGLRSKGSL